MNDALFLALSCAILASLLFVGVYAGFTWGSAEMAKAPNCHNAENYDNPDKLKACMYDRDLATEVPVRVITLSVFGAAGVLFFIYGVITGLYEYFTEERRKKAL